MCWLGFAKRCVEIAQAYVSERQGFGIKLADRESVQIKLGELAQQIQIGRLLTNKRLAPDSVFERSGYRFA